MSKIHYHRGLERRRRAWTATTCFSTEKTPQTVPFSWIDLGEFGMAHGITPDQREHSFDIQCFPLYSLLLASAGQVTVNYLSLDIEGAEFEVLKTIPWDKVDIEVITVETFHSGKVFPGSRQEVRSYLEEQGYVLVTTLVVDDVFVRRDLFHGKYSPDLKQQEKFSQNQKVVAKHAYSQVEFKEEL